jgi:hypothetical protein
MLRWREARDTGSTLSSEEQKELEALVDAELQSTKRRAESIISDLQI